MVLFGIFGSGGLFVGCHLGLVLILCLLWVVDYGSVYVTFDWYFRFIMLF